VAGFLGYLIGRWGDYYLVYLMKDPDWAPHHWIYGAIMMIAALFFFENSLEAWIFAFGLGLFVSDLKDFWDMKFYGADNKDKSKRRFWHID